MDTETKEKLAAMGLNSNEEITAAADRIATANPYSSPPYGTSDGAIIVAAAAEIAAESKSKG